MATKQSRTGLPLFPELWLRPRGNWRLWGRRNSTNCRRSERSK